MRRRIHVAVSAIWLGLVLAFPVLAAPNRLVPVGKTVGLELETDGVYVAAFDTESGPSPAEEAGLRVGDRLLALNGTTLDQASTLREQLSRSSGEPAVLSVERDGRAMGFTVRPAFQEGGWRLGVMVRDRIAGLGTVTFYDPESGLFGALGHGVNTSKGDILEIRSGDAFETTVSGVKRGQSGTPGSLLGQAAGGDRIGSVERNTPQGLFGHSAAEELEGEALPLAEREEITTGPAEIWSNVSGDRIECYAVEIEAVRFDREQCRDLRLVVTDPRLLAQTGGIVQGMSGSPIIQNGKLIGAVTHVLVRDPTRGYGILIGHMLDAAEGEAA